LSLLKEVTDLPTVAETPFKFIFRLLQENKNCAWVFPEQSYHRTVLVDCIYTLYHFPGSFLALALKV